MDSKQLFPVSENGYDCAAVEKYIDQLTAEYKKVYEYAKKVEESRKATEANNEKLKKIARVLKKENDALKGKAE
ncbi:MAG: DivIVA domain-containing protein [Clostridia bacterium]|nr:DivIVA domain-containing protein [Clostridia bacterium]